MAKLKDLIMDGKIETVFTPLLAHFPQAIRYLSEEMLDEVWEEVKSHVESRGSCNTNQARDEIINDLLGKDHVELASEIDSDPFKTLIRTILSARSRDEQTIKVSNHLFEYYDTAEKLAKAPEDHVKEIIKPIGFYNVKSQHIINAAVQLLEDHDGKVPDTMEELVALPGVGLKVAGCVLVYAFDKPAIPVDTHVHRIVNRWGLVETKNAEKTNKFLREIFPRKWWKVINDLMVRFGKKICRPIGPKCTECPLESCCPKIIIVKPKKTKRKK